MAASYIASAEEDLICPVCFEIFADPHTPKMLDCPHVYCQLCLAVVLDKHVISCPECRKKTTVQDGDISLLKTNLRLRSLAEKHKQHTEHKSGQQPPDNDLMKTAGQSFPVCTKHIMRKLALQPGLIDCRYRINGISSGPQGILAVSIQEKQRVCIYQKRSDGEYKHMFNLQPTQKDWFPFNVEVADDGTFLVARYNCVELFRSSGKYYKTIKLNDDDYRLLYDGVVTDAIITHDLSGKRLIIVAENHTNSFLKYTFDGALVKRLTTSVNVTPWYIAKICDGHQWPSVAMTDLNEQVAIMSLYPEEGGFTRRADIANATALSYDKKTDCLLIGRKDAEQDAESGAVIEQYCRRTLGLVGRLAEGLKDPQAMTFIDDDTLAVADDKAIKFYKVTMEL